MKVENVRYVIAEEKLWLYDIVVLVDGKCRRATSAEMEESNNLFQVSESAIKGSKVTLCNDNTIFHVQEK